MKLLVLDRSRLLYHLVQRIVPEDVDVVYTPSFRKALDEIKSHNTDAVVAELRHSHLPWVEFQDICFRQEPQIPVLFQSSSESRAEESCLRELCGRNSFITEPYHASELKEKVLQVLEEAQRSNGGDQVKAEAAVH